jgi:hypothetical protein
LTGSKKQPGSPFCASQKSAARVVYNIASADSRNHARFYYGSAERKKTQSTGAMKNAIRLRKYEMKKIAILFVIAILFTSCSKYVPFTVDLSGHEYTTYEIASIVSGCPVEILQGMAFAESTTNQDAIGDDGISTGRFQINERFHAYYAKLYGEYNQWCPLDTAILTGKIYMADLAYFGNKEDAIAAHRQGRTGVRTNGRDEWYVERVLNYPKELFL